MIAIKIQSTDQQQITGVEQQPQGKPSVQKQAVNTAILNGMKQIGVQSIQQYADLTGNYAFSETASDLLTIGADIGTIAVGGVVGAIVVASKYAINITNSFVGLKRETDNIMLARQRAGSLSTQGSRYSK